MKMSVKGMIIYHYVNVCKASGVLWTNKSFVPGMSELAPNWVRLNSHIFVPI